MHDRKKIALCIEAEHLDGAMFYRFELQPPCKFQGAWTEHFDVISDKKKTQFIADNRAWMGIDDLAGQSPIDQLLLDHFQYHEPLVSKLYRIRERWGDLEKPPMKHVQYRLMKLWSDMDEEQQLIVSIIAEFSAKEIEQAVKAATTDAWEHEDYDR